MRGSRDICYTDSTGFSHRTRDDVFPGAVDSTQAATSLPDLTVGLRKYLGLHTAALCGWSGPHAW